MANLTEVNDTTLTSTLTIPSAGSVANESVILCQGLSGDSDSTVVRHRGKIPGCCTWARCCDVEVCHMTSLPGPPLLYSIASNKDSELG